MLTLVGDKSSCEGTTNKLKADIKDWVLIKFVPYLDLTQDLDLDLDVDKDLH